MFDVWMKMAAQFFRVFLDAGHDISWLEGSWERAEKSGGFLIYFTTDRAIAERAKRALKREGILCDKVLDGPRDFSGKESP